MVKDKFEEFKKMGLSVFSAWLELVKDGKENRNFIDLPFEEIRLTQDINKVIMVHTPRFFEKNFTFY